MGGLLIVLVVLGHLLLPAPSPGPATFAPLAALAGVGALGAFDDYLNARTGEGIRARQKLAVADVVVAFVAACRSSRHTRSPPSPCRSSARRDRPGAVRRSSPPSRSSRAANGVNITDGLDGLAGGTLVDRVRRLHAHRAAQRADPAEPRARCAR